MSSSLLLSTKKTQDLLSNGGNNDKNSLDLRTRRVGSNVQKQAMGSAICSFWGDENEDRLIRKRPVSFGVLDNFHGNVYTIPTTTRPTITTDTDTATDIDNVINRVVAMLRVLPEHVPEGILNLIRSHRPYIEHVRVVIAYDNDNYEEDEDEDQDKEENGDGNNNKNSSNSIDETKNNDNNNGKTNDRHYDYDYDENNGDKYKTRNNNHSNKTYLILVQLFCEKYAIEFIEDLNGKPYIAFDDRDTCQLERVVGLETITPSSILATTTATKHSKSKIVGDEVKEQHSLSQQSNNGNTSKMMTSLLFYPVNATTTTDTTSITNATTNTMYNNSSTNSFLNTSFTTTATSAGTTTGAPKDDREEEKKDEIITSRATTIATSTTATANTTARIRDDNNIQNCAVCLEPLLLGLSQQQQQNDGNDSGLGSTRSVVATSSTSTCPTHKQQQQQQQPLLTTVCNHTFHLDCLSQCNGPCPVCRYDHSILNGDTFSQCHICGTTENNYVCLICGVISCQNGHNGYNSNDNDINVGQVPATATASTTTAPSSSSSSSSFVMNNSHNFITTHAGQHYKETLHAYALDTVTQHVYDFCGQGWVHRLVISPSFLQK